VDFHGKNCSIFLQYAVHVFFVGVVFTAAPPPPPLSLSLFFYIFLSSKGNINLTILCFLRPVLTDG